VTGTNPLQVQNISAHPGVRHLLVEKTDRLYRNIKDWVTLDGFDIELHLVKEGTVLSRDSRSSRKVYAWDQGSRWQKLRGQPL
jgi:hypothetical protein